MNLRENNFSFGGLHCLRDFGLIYAESGGHTITPPASRNTYNIAGVSGTILMPGVTYGCHRFPGNLYFMKDPPDQTNAQENLRKIGAWLLNGQQRLVFDYEPLRYYLANVNAPAKWDYDKWIEGGLAIEFEAQPYAYNARENNASLTTATEENSLTLVADTGCDAPLKATVTNTGTAAITGVAIAANGKSAAFSGMHIEAGARLDISMEPPIGAVFSTGDSALPYASRFDIITVQTGSNPISVTLQYATGTKGARIEVSARGRFL